MTYPPITKAVFPIAGLATRMMPITKAVSKEMLPVFDRPLIEFAVVEALQAGIETFIFIIAPHQEQIKGYFAPNPTLLDVLKQQNRHEELAALHSLHRLSDSIHYVVQDMPLGLGHAVYCAQDIIGDDAFAVISPDDLLFGHGLEKLVQGWNDTGVMQVLVEEIALDLAHLYGIVGFRDEKTGALAAMIEKPQQTPPSPWGIIGRYVLPARIFAHLAKLPPNHKGEIQLTDAMVHVMEEAGAYAQKYHARRIDCGSLRGWREANQLLASGMVTAPSSLHAVMRARSNTKQN
ncbi:MAG: sugar phosphate nucleotidyltransferase [Pseudomonadota bacterium]